MYWKDKQILDKGIIDKIFLKSDICRKALFDSEFPYVVPLNYGELYNEFNDSDIDDITYIILCTI